MSGTTMASAPFSNAIGTPKLASRGGAAARAGGKTWHAARRPHGRSGSFASFSLRARRVRLSSETHRESRRDGPAALGPVRNIRASILRHQLNCGVSASLYDAITDVVDAS